MRLLVLVLTHGDFIVLPNCKTGLPAPYNILFSHIILILSKHCPILALPSIGIGCDYDLWILVILGDLTSSMHHCAVGHHHDQTVTPAKNTKASDLVGVLLWEKRTGGGATDPI